MANLKFHSEAPDCQGHCFIYKICIIEKKKQQKEKKLMGMNNSVVIARETEGGWGEKIYQG